MPTILITGAASGIGHAFLEHYASDASNRILALDRRPPSLPSATPAKVETHLVDLASEADVARFAASLAATRLDLVVHCAGVRGLVPAVERAHPHDVGRAETLRAMDAATMARAFAVNALGAFLLFQALVPSLLLHRHDDGDAAAEQDSPRRRRRPPPPTVVVMTSRMGSVSANVAGGAYAYRASKAALNAVVRSLAVDVPGAVWLLVHPGRVETGLVRTTEAGAVGAEESVRDMLRFLEGVDGDASGKFFDRWGNEIGW